MTLWKWLFWCRHPDFSFPQTRRIGGRRAGVYVACLKCGSEFEYDWNRMEIVRSAAKYLNGGK